jgi:hypothetical protein
MAAHLSFKEREDFTHRLKTSLKSVGLNPNSPAQVMSAFLEHADGLKVSHVTVYKWLLGEALPDTRNMEIVARLCNVCPHWLRTGVPKRNQETAQELPDH